jgi:hypothetical protein
MAGRRSKLLILVAFYFAYLAARGIEDLLLHDQSAGYIVHANVGLLPHYLGASIALTALAAASAVLLWKRHPLGLYIGLVTLALGLVEFLLELEVWASDLDLAKQAYAINRSARGFPIAPGLLDEMFTPTGIYVVRTVALWMTGLPILLLLVGWSRSSPARRVGLPPSSSF